MTIPTKKNIARKTWEKINNLNKTFSSHSEDLKRNEIVLERMKKVLERSESNL